MDRENTVHKTVHNGGNSMGKLTVQTLKTLTKPGMYADGDTLFFRIAPGGSRQWVQRSVIRGRRTNRGLGSYPLVTLAKARVKAFENRQLARQGEDPVIVRKREQEPPTFGEAVEAVIALNQGRWKDGGRTAEQWRNSMRDYVFPSMEHIRVSDIISRDVMKVLGPIWTKKPGMADKIKVRISMTLDWSISQNYRETNPVMALSKTLKRDDRNKRHFKSVPYQDVRGVIETIKQSKAYPSTVACFHFLVLTATRSGEARGMMWRECDIEAGLWTVPAIRMKAGQEFRVPLSSQAVEILTAQRARKNSSAFVFPSLRRKMLSDNTLSKLLRDNRIDAHPHGFRASFRKWAEECGQAPFAVAEKALSHTVGDSVVQAYLYGTDLFELRRGLMERWGAYLTFGSK